MQLSISKLCSAMREYQKNNNIVEQCMTNTQTLYDIVKLTYPDADVKAIPVICLNYIDVSDAVVKTAENCCFTTLGQSCFENLEEDDTPILKQTIHLILKVNDIFYEPSYELYTAKARYFTSIKNLLDGVVPNTIIKNNLKNILPHFLHFVDLSERINKGELLIADKEYYNNQLDYLIYNNFVCCKTLFKKSISKNINK